MTQAPATRRRGIAPEALGPTLTVGEILVEIMAATRGRGFLEPLALTGPYPSGAPAIFIDQVARLGGGACLVGTVGRDDFGTLNVERLRRDGVDVSAIRVDERLPTGSAFVRYREDGGRDFVYNIATSAAGGIALTPAVRAAAGRAGHLHVMGTALSIPGAWEVIAFALEAVKGRGGSLSLDPNLRKELAGAETAGRFRELVAQADLLLPSGEELFVAAGLEQGSEAEAVEALLATGVGEVVLKRGADGSSFFAGGDMRVDCAAVAVEEVDPTGAGDCFGAAYLTCRRLGMAPTAALRYANAAGARTVTRQGPMEGAGSLAELDAFMTEREERR